MIDRSKFCFIRRYHLSNFISGPLFNSMVSFELFDGFDADLGNQVLSVFCQVAALVVIAYRTLCMYVSLIIPQRRVAALATIMPCVELARYVVSIFIESITEPARNADLTVTCADELIENGLRFLVQCRNMICIVRFLACRCCFL